MHQTIDTSRYLPAKKVAQYFDVSPNTLRAWAEQKKINYLRTSGGHRRYDISSFGKESSSPKNQTKKETEPIPQIRFGAIYCRVSSHKQKDDLQRQIKLCQEKYPNYKVYSDICSGLKYQRKALPRLLEQVTKGLVTEIVVAHKDRLARFGTELIQWILDQKQTLLVILDEPHTSPEQELTEDLMAIVHVFSCRLNGKRRYTSGQKGEKSKESSLQKCRRKDSTETKSTVRRRVAEQAAETDARKTYNLAVQYIQKHHLILPEEKINERLSQQKLTSLLEARLIPKAVLENTVHAYLLKTPKVVRQQAIRRLCATVEGYYTRVKERLELRQKHPQARRFQKPIPFNLRFKAKTFTSDAFFVEKCSLTQTGNFTFNVYKNLKDGLGCKKHENQFPLRNIHIKHRQEPLEASMFEKDTGFAYKFGKWYYMAPVYWHKRVMPVYQDRDQVGAIDPGVRKFATVYSPEGQVTFYGTNTQKVISKHLRRIDRRRQAKQRLYLQHKQGKTTDVDAGRRLRKKRRRRALRKQRERYHQAESKLKNSVKNMHYQVAHDLCRSFETVINPTFSSKDCVKKVGRRMSVWQTRICQALSHYQFRIRLKETASKYGTTLIKGSEAYTSRQCGECGFINDKLFGDEVFHCHNCQAEGDRDAHASRNILLRFIKCQDCHLSGKKSCVECIKPVKVLFSSAA